MVQVRQSALAVELCGIPLATPLIPAAGTLAKEALGEVKGVYGALLPTKTVTPEPWAGNPPPRLAEVSSGMVNSIGLQSLGLKSFLENLDDYDIELPIFVSIAADTVGRFAMMCERLVEDERVSAVELNLSCLNRKHYGHDFCADPGTVRKVVSACRDALCSKPLFAKLANDDVVTHALAAQETGADALTLINTVPALVVDAKERRLFLRGGLSGPAIKPIALRAVHEVSRVVDVPVIGVGGVTSGTDVAEFMLAGATAVQVGSGSFVREPREILEEFTAYLQEKEDSARDLTGALTDL